MQKKIGGKENGHNNGKVGGAYGGQLVVGVQRQTAGGLGGGSGVRPGRQWSKRGSGRGHGADMVPLPLVAAPWSNGVECEAL